MAYLIELARHCPCGKRAVVRVMNRWNADCGDYCRACGTRKLTELKAAEVVPDGV